MTMSDIHPHYSTCSPGTPCPRTVLIIGISERAAIIEANVLLIWNIFYLMMYNWIISGKFLPCIYLVIYPSRHEEQPRPFVLHSCLKNSRDEVRFLQMCSRVLVFCLLPSKDSQSLSLRIMLAEILTTKGRFMKFTPLVWCVQTNVLYTLSLYFI